MHWKFRNDLPIYTQLIAQIKLAIVTGEFAAGQKLPPVREFAADAGVNPNTMQRALADLEQENLIYAQRTAGRFVTSDMYVIDHAKFQLAQEQMQNFLTAMSQLGYDKQQAIALLQNKEKEDPHGIIGM